MLKFSLKPKEAFQGSLLNRPCSEQQHSSPWLVHRSSRRGLWSPVECARDQAVHSMQECPRTGHLTMSSCWVTTHECWHWDTDTERKTWTFGEGLCHQPISGNTFHSSWCPGLDDKLYTIRPWSWFFHCFLCHFFKIRIPKYILADYCMCCRESKPISQPIRAVTSTKASQQSCMPGSLQQRGSDQDKAVGFPLPHASTARILLFSVPLKKSSLVRQH